MEWLLDPQIWIALLTLTALEIVLGIDNIVFISILAGRLSKDSQNRARQWGLALAMLMRILLLLSLTWIMGLTRSLFSIADFDITGRSLI
jgi:predicted tellurium resistance membrane protein TerC